MPAEDEPRRYSTDDEHLLVIKTAYTPAELREILRDIGPGIDDWRSRNTVIEEFIIERHTWRLVWKAFFRVMGWVAAILVTIATIRSLLPPGVWPW
jgi:hypothetical protein